MLHKIRIIFFRTLGWICVCVISLLISFLFAIQSYSFQTWLGSKVGSYLSEQLKTKVLVKRIELDFFKKIYFIICFTQYILYIKIKWHCIKNNNRRYSYRFGIFIYNNTKFFYKRQEIIEFLLSKKIRTI